MKNIGNKITYTNEKKRSYVERRKNSPKFSYVESGKNSSYLQQKLQSTKEQATPNNTLNNNLIIIIIIA